MIDREEVIAMLEANLRDFWEHGSADIEGDCLIVDACTIEQAIALLKAQEADINALSVKYSDLLDEKLKAQEPCEDAVSRRAAIEALTGYAKTVDNTGTYGAVLQKTIEYLPSVTPKAQEPRLLTPEDFVDNPNIDNDGKLPCWSEWKHHPEWNGWATIVRICEAPTEDLIKRNWTARPTDAQMEAIPWES